MFIIECIPLSRGFQKETLSYFTGKVIPVGSLVTVPLRNKKVPALVVKATPLPKEKMAIKDASFSLKKLDSVKSETLYFEQTVEAAMQTAKYYAGSVGNILKEFTPQIILENGHGIKNLIPPKISEIKNETFILQTNEEDRVLEYKGLIRECFAKNESVLICFPTVEEMLRFHSELKRGIDDYTFIFHSGLSKKEFYLLWKKALTEPHPVLIIGTPFVLTIPRSDTKLLIVEQESSRYYKSQSGPYSDARIFAEKLATALGIKLIFGDRTLRVETLYRETIGELHRFPASKMRITATARVNLIDMKKDVSGEKRIFEVIGSEVKSLITEAAENNERVFLFAARRGLSPVTLCGDCGNIVTCNHCGAPVILHRIRQNKNPDQGTGASQGHFLCHHCGERRNALESCKLCDSWNLKDFGIGVEKVAETVGSMFPNMPVFELSRDNAKTPKIAREIFEKFIKTPKSILVGTEFATPYFTHKVERSAIVSLDSLFAVPDYKIIEKIFSLILSIRRLTKHHLVIQTRTDDSFVFTVAMRGDVIGFYREEIKKRELFNWPPFSTIIKISIEAKKDRVVKAMRELVEMFLPYELEVFPAFIPKKKGLYALNALLRLPKHQWVDEKILAILKKLPPFYKVEVDPETIL